MLHEKAIKQLDNGDSKKKKRKKKIDKGMGQGNDLVKINANVNTAKFFSKQL